MITYLLAFHLKLSADLKALVSVSEHNTQPAVHKTDRLESSGCQSESGNLKHAHRAFQQWNCNCISIKLVGGVTFCCYLEQMGRERRPQISLNVPPFLFKVR